MPGSETAAAFEGGQHIAAGRLMAGARPNTAPAEDGEREGGCQHVPVQAGAQGEILASVGQQQGQEAYAPEGQEESQNAAGGSQQDAFGEKLADHAHTSGADAEAHGHLAPAGGGAREQQVRGVGAGEGEEQADHGPKHVEGLGIAAAQSAQAAGARHDGERGERGALASRWWRWRPPTGGRAAPATPGLAPD